MEFLKVGDIKECTIIGLDMDRRRISLSLKSDAMSRLGQGGGAKPAASSESTEGKVRVVRAVRPGEKKTVTVVAGKRPVNDKKPAGNFNNNRNSGSDDGMSYNPFAALLKK